MASSDKAITTIAKGAARLLPQRARKGILSFLQSVVPARRVPNSFSQCGEDRILSFLFDSLKIERPTYLDIGTCHPSNSNNTYLFYLRGSSGVCIEPNPDLAPIIREIRPRDTVLNAGVAAEAGGECTYYMFADPQLNTFSKMEADARIRSGKNTLLQQRPVPLIGIRTLVTEHFANGVDLLSLDVEGFDLAVLQAWDFGQCRPLSICVETVGYTESLAKPKTHEITALLVNKGYGVYADTFVNTIYIDQDRTGSIKL